jgi:hypothetical protein
MSISNVLLESLKDRLNTMTTEVIQMCLDNKLDSNDKCFCEKNREKLTMIILHEIAEGHIKSSWFTKEQAEHAIHLYEYLHDCEDNEYTNCDCFKNANDYKNYDKEE